MTARPSTIRTSLSCVLIAGAVEFALAGGQAARDAAPRAVTGTASVVGTVVTNESDAKPIRRATVTLNAALPGQFSQRVTVTDDQGRFSFTSLPAANYSAPRVAKPGYVAAQYGEKRVGGIGTPITLAEGQRLTIAFKMYKGAVITGTLRDRGRVFPGTSVSAAPVRVVNGVKTRGSSSSGNAQTDDRGVYRIYGLAPGDYVVSATPRIGSGEIRPITDAEIQWGERQLQPGAASAVPGTLAAPPRPAQAVASTPIYYPGVTDASQAGVVTLGPGEERGGVDLEVAFVATAKVEGTVVDAEGRPALNAQINLVSNVESASLIGDSFMLFEEMMIFNRPTVTDGKFTMAGVRPGSYTIAVRAGDRSAVAAGGSGRSGAPPATLWASADITVNGEDQSGIELRLQRGMELSGKLVFDGNTLPPPADFSRVTVRLSAAPSPGGVTISVNVPSAQPAPDGSFKLEGVTPGRYFLNATVPGAVPAADSPSGAQWMLRSARVGNVDAADQPFDVRPNENLSDVVLTFTDRAAELSGTLLDATGKPTPALSIILFSTDRTMWTQRSRRLRPPVRASTEGKFRFANLPAGEYYLAALTDFEPGDVYKPEFLEQVAAAALKVTIAEGEKKVQDLKISGGFLTGDDR